MDRLGVSFVVVVVVVVDVGNVKGNGGEAGSSSSAVELSPGQPQSPLRLFQLDSRFLDHSLPK